jgi:polyisoprenoid-binding protein YceI
MHSSVNFTVDHLGLTTIYGRFNKFTGKYSLDRAAKTGSLDAAVDTVSVDTNENDKGSRARSRDEHLRSADFFNAAEFPKMTYKSTKVVFNGDNPSAIEGNLTLIGVTHPVNLTVERFKCNPPSGTGKERCGGVVVGKLKRSDFGMKRGIPGIGDEIGLVIAFEGDKE